MSGDLRDPGDAWVLTDSGERYWGRFGAAGLLALDPARGVLLQHRVSWSHFGGTWALPGGARHEGESAADAALRESAEEAGVPARAVADRFMSVYDIGVWSYSTLVADVITPFEAVISDPESVALEWVPVDRVDQLPLHPGFASAWPTLRAQLGVRPAVIVDAANVVGSVPNGWWRERAGAASGLLEQIDALSSRGVAGESLGLLAGTTWYPEWHVVLEGYARDADAAGESGVHVYRAGGSGDDEIVRVAEGLIGQDRTVTVVTSDRGLGERVHAAGGSVRPVSWLREQL